MKISNNNPGGVRPPSPNDPAGKGKAAGGEFSVTPEKPAKALGEVASRYKAEDLKDAGKAESAIRESLRAIAGDQPIARGLPPEHLEKLLDFMQADPLIRARITSYLQKTLS